MFKDDISALLWRELSVHRKLQNIPKTHRQDINKKREKSYMVKTTYIYSSIFTRFFIKCSILQEENIKKIVEKTNLLLKQNDL